MYSLRTVDYNVFTVEQNGRNQNGDTKMTNLTLTGTADVLETTKQPLKVWSVIETLFEEDFKSGPISWNPLFKSIDDALDAIKDHVQGQLMEFGEPNSDSDVDRAIQINRHDKDFETANVFWDDAQVAYFVKPHEIELSFITK